jgi:hypothetical protein
VTEQKRQGADADAPKEIVELIAFLASEKANGLNGEAITVALEA